MLIVVENVLDAQEVRNFRERLNSARWIDGAPTAGTRSVAVKQNLQLDRNDADATELGNIILRKLGHHPLFISASLAEKIWPPVFNEKSIAPFGPTTCVLVSAIQPCTT